MPILKNATVQSTENIWNSPDGQRKMFKVRIQLETGQVAEAKSWSERLVPGFKGDLETYEKEGKMGMETFVKQAPKEGGYSGGGRQFGTTGKAPSDPFTMYLSYAKDIAVAMLANGGELKPDVYEAILQQVLNGGNTLYEGRPGAESVEKESKLFPEPSFKSDPVHEVTDEPINLNDIPF